MKNKNTTSIPLERLLGYAVIIPICLLFLAVFWAHSTISSAEDQRDSLLLLGQKILRKSNAQEANREILSRYKNKDPLFVHKVLEEIPLLNSEVDSLRSRLSKSALPDDSALEKRLSLLTSENGLCFIEGLTETMPGWKETTENLNKPVEVDTEDLSKILSIIEVEDDKNFPKKPHMFISEAHLDRKKGVFVETWGLSLKIVRREYQ